jgi:hypothetical protein
MIPLRILSICSPLVIGQAGLVTPTKLPLALPALTFAGVLIRTHRILTACTLGSCTSRELTQRGEFAKQSGWLLYKTTRAPLLRCSRTTVMTAKQPHLPGVQHHSSTCSTCGHAEDTMTESPQHGFTRAWRQQAATTRSININKRTSILNTVLLAHRHLGLLGHSHSTYTHLPPHPRITDPVGG